MLRAHYVRTDGYLSDGIYPAVTVFKSVGDVAGYYEANKDRFNLEGRGTRQPYEEGFMDVAGDLDEAFFAGGGFAVAVALEEPSGSNRHRVKGVGEDGTVTIRRMVAEVGTADMAEWHIIVVMEGTPAEGGYAVNLTLG